MKYFAHLCTAQDDDKFDLLFDRHSFEGYGVYWWLCEHVGRRKKTANDNPEYLINTNRRRIERGMKMERVLKIVRSLSDFHLIEIIEEPGWIAVKIPKLNAYSAEWQKRLSKGNYGGTPESTPERLPSRLGREVVDRRKREKDLRPTPPASTVEAVEPSSEIDDPKARAEAMKTIRKAMGELPSSTTPRPEQKASESGNGKIPKAEGPEVDLMFENLGDLLLPEPVVEDVLNAWWANKQGTHDSYAIVSALDKHGIKGHDRTRIYKRLGVV